MSTEIIIWLSGLLLGGWASLKIAVLATVEEDGFLGATLGVVGLVVSALWLGIPLWIGYMIWKWGPALKYVFGNKKFFKRLSTPPERFDVDAMIQRRDDLQWWNKYRNHVELALLEAQTGQSVTVDRDITVDARHVLCRGHVSVPNRHEMTTALLYINSNGKQGRLMK